MESLDRYKKTVRILCYIALVPAFYLLIIGTVDILHEKIGFTLPAWYNQFHKVDYAIVPIIIIMSTISLLSFINLIMLRRKRYRKYK